MKRPKLAAAVFAVAAGAVWMAEVLWLRRARRAGQRPAEEAWPDRDVPQPLVSAPDAGSTP